MDAVLRRLMRAASSRGYAGGQMAWLAVAAALWTLRRARRPSPSGRSSFRVQPGEKLVIKVRQPGGADH